MAACKSIHARLVPSEARTSESLGLKLYSLLATLRGLGIKPRSSRRAAALSTAKPSLQPLLFCLMCFRMYIWEPRSHIYVCEPHSCLVTEEAQRGKSDPSELELQIAVSLHMDTGSSVRAANTCPAPVSFILKSNHLSG